MAMSGVILACHNLEEVLLVSGKRRPRMLLNILKSTAKNDLAPNISSAEVEKHFIDVRNSSFKNV